MKNKNIKYLIVSGVALFSIFGSTLAYYSTNTVVKSIYKTAKYQNVISKEFTAPTNWLPGETVDSTITVKNTGNTPMAIRVAYEEKWLNDNGDELSLEDANGNRVALIEINKEWTKGDDGYYYYSVGNDDLYELQEEEVTTSFINNVTLNPKVRATLNATASSDDSTYSNKSIGMGYDNATYTIIMRFETLQYDAASNIWK